MKSMDIIENQWRQLESFVSSRKKIEESARTCGALTRRRAVGSGSDLLRLAFVYCFCGLSLRQTAAWAEAADIASISDVALMKRLRSCADWFGSLLSDKLDERAPMPDGSWRLRIVDATTVSAPGSKGTDWRVHLGLDLGASRIDSVELTDVRGGETLRRFDVGPGDLILGDRGYAHRPGLLSVLEKGGHFLVRYASRAVPLENRDGSPFLLLPALRELQDTVPGDFALRISPDPAQSLPAADIRLIAIRRSEEAAEAARAQVINTASRRCKTIQPATLELASYVLVVTSLSTTELPADKALDLYRFRWQIEIEFKRLKGLLHLDELPAKDPRLARTFILCKILAALVLEEFTEAFVSISPWGFRLA